jgi:hypothetical protein
MYARVLRHRIRAKNVHLQGELTLLGGTGLSVMKNCNGITEFCNRQQKQSSAIQAPFVEKRWAKPDLNRRPLARKGTEIALEDQNELLERFRDLSASRFAKKQTHSLRESLLHQRTAQSFKNPAEIALPALQKPKKGKRVDCFLNF